MASLLWETALEIDVACFSLWRELDHQRVDAVPISAGLIAAQGSPGWGATYHY
jgi:hypothetical protein